MEVLDRLESTNTIAWIMKNNIKNERGQPIQFDDFAFMIDPYLDWTPLQGVRKASQCGWSTMTNLKLDFAAKHGIPGYDVPAANVIYTLPSDQDVSVFVPSKTNLLISQNPCILNYMKDENGNKSDSVDSIQRKKIGGSMVYFKGTRSKTAAIMLTADLLIHDEADRSEKNIIDEYESRVAQSKYRGRWIFSNPSAPNMPADLMYLQSDQKHWFIKCEHCGYWQYLDWYKLSEYEFHVDESNPHCFIDDTNGWYVCGKCCRVLSNDNRKRGRWVRKFKDREASGYWVTHFMYSWISAKQLVQVEKNKSKAYFMNFVRGLPYIGSDVIVDAQTIVNNIVLTPPNWIRGQVAMGVDNGDIKHYVIGNETGIFEYGKTKDWEVIEKLIQKYEPKVVIDQNPYPARPRELAAKYRPIDGKKWRIWLSYYIEESKNYELVDWGEGDKAHMVYPVRNLLFDELISYIANGNIKFLQAKSYWEQYISHWETMYRADMVGTRLASEVGTNVPGVTVQGKWLSSTGMDHWAHATLYWHVAMMKLHQGQGQVLTGNESPATIIQREQGKILQVPDILGSTMPQTRKIIPDLSANKPRSGNGSVSGKM